MIFLVYCVVSLLDCMMCLCGPLALRDVFHTPMSRCSLFVLEVPCNANYLADDVHD